MLRRGDVLDLSPLGARFVIKKIGSETNGESFEMEWELAPQTGGTPVHIHPDAIETYEVLDGHFDVFVDGEWKTLPAGENVVVESGVPHTFRNSSPETTRVHNTHQPAMRFDNYFEGLHTLVERGIIKSDRMTIKALLHVSMLMTAHEEEIRSVKPPHAVVRLFAAVGRTLGYRIEGLN